MKKYPKIGENIIVLESVNSSNHYAMELLNKNLVAHGTCVRALYQSEGKGQQQHSWHATANENLLCSIVLDSQALLLENQFLLNAYSTVCVHKLLQQYLHIDEIKIKWPNDIFVAHKKICGILIENSIRGQQWTAAVLGIGLNINQNDFSQIPMATSLFKIFQKSFQVEDIFLSLLAILDKEWQNTMVQPEKIMQEYKQYLLGFEKERNYLIEGETISGKIIDIKKDGTLALRSANKTSLFKHKELAYIID